MEIQKIRFKEGTNVLNLFVSFMGTFWAISFGVVAFLINNDTISSNLPLTLFVIAYWTLTVTSLSNFLFVMYVWKTKKPNSPTWGFLGFGFFNMCTFITGALNLLRYYKQTELTKLFLAVFKIPFWTAEILVVWCFIMVLKKYLK